MIQSLSQRYSFIYCCYRKRIGTAIISKMQRRLNGPVTVPVSLYDYNDTALLSTSSR
jgi:hypothetical protein